MKRYVLFFLISFFSLYFLLSGLFGVKGYFYNNSLKKQIAETRLEAERLSEVVEKLKGRREYLETEEGLRDSAAGLGYYVKGDEVYYFDTIEKQEDIHTEKETERSIPFTGLSVLTILLLDLGISAFITFIVYYLSNSEKPEKPEDFDDYPLDNSDLYINA